jgi:hypothetical protein
MARNIINELLSSKTDNIFLHLSPEAGDRVLVILDDYQLNSVYRLSEFYKGTETTYAVRSDGSILREFHKKLNSREMERLYLEDEIQILLIDFHDDCICYCDYADGFVLIAFGPDAEYLIQGANLTGVNDLDQYTLRVSGDYLAQATRLRRFK